MKTGAAYYDIAIFNYSLPMPLREYNTPRKGTRGDAYALPIPLREYNIPERARGGTRLITYVVPFLLHAQ